MPSHSSTVRLMLHGGMAPGSSFVRHRVLRLDLVAQKTLVLVARPLFLASLLFLHLGAIKARKEACRNEIKAASHQSAPPPPPPFRYFSQGKFEVGGKFFPRVISVETGRGFSEF